MILDYIPFQTIHSYTLIIILRLYYSIFTFHILYVLHHLVILSVVLICAFCHLCRDAYAYCTIESDKTTSIYNVSTRVLSKK